MNGLRIASLIALVLLAGADRPAHAAGAYGHVIIANRALDGMLSGEQPLPDELKDALNDPDGRRAFRGGSVAPDICENQSHYGETADLVRSMGAKAVRNLEAAKKSGDPKKIKEARIQVAFSYGWLSHVAADVNIHPLVNGIAGDSYKYCTEGQRAIHAGQEVQLDKYLNANYRKPGEKFDVVVPENFLSEFVGLKPNQLRHNLRALKIRVAGEIAGKEFVYLSNNEQLKPKWELCVTNCIADSRKLIADPGRMGNWDLDSGPISTNDFRDLRMLVKEANGGKLPANWGGNYLDYYHRALDAIEKSEKTQTADEPSLDTPRFNLPPLPKMHKQPTEADKVQLKAWREKCVAQLNKQMEEDPLRAANKAECLAIPRENREITCGKCGFAGVHWWIEPSWSCPKCEFCTMPQDLKRADGTTYREFAAQRMKLYQDKIVEVETVAAKY